MDVVLQMWRDKVIKDDKVLQSNDKGYMTFATVCGLIVYLLVVGELC